MEKAAEEQKKTAQETDTLENDQKEEPMNEGAQNADASDRELEEESLQEEDEDSSSQDANTVDDIQETDVQDEAIPQEDYMATDTEDEEAAESVEETNEVDPDLKAFLDSYEVFTDEYVEFMKKYNEDPQNVASMLMEYAEIMGKYEDFAGKLEQYDEDEMSTADAKHYLEVTSRCAQKMLDIYTECVRNNRMPKLRVRETLAGDGQSFFFCFVGRLYVNILQMLFRRRG